MQNWNDNMITRMPGVRDRVARVRLEENEGGMNLDMEKERIQSIASKGEAAALKLIERFAKPANGNGQAAGWDEHRLVRLNVLLKMIEARAPGVLSALGTCDHATCFEDLISAAAKGPLPAAGYDALWTDAEKAALEDVLKALAGLGKVAIPANANRFVPIPNPELRVRPPL
jgi:hypothetical protein